MKYKLNEKIYGNLATVYHGTNSDPMQFIDSLFTPGSGDYYGAGLYTVYEPEYQKNDPDTEDLDRTPSTLSNTANGNYGDTLIKMYASLHDCLNWDALLNAFRKANNHLEELTNFPPELEKVAKQVLKKQLNNSLFIQVVISWLKKLGYYYISQADNSNYTSDIARPFYTDNPSLPDKISGMVYTGRNDGKCFVIYSSRNYYPVAYKKIVTEEGDMLPFEEGWIKFPKDALSVFQRKQQQEFKRLRGIIPNEDEGVMKNEKEKVTDFIKEKLQKINEIPRGDIVFRTKGKGWNLISFMEFIMKMKLDIWSIPEMYSLVFRVGDYESAIYFINNFILGDEGRHTPLLSNSYYFSLGFLVAIIQMKLEGLFNLSLDELATFFFTELDNCPEIFFYSPIFKTYLKIAKNNIPEDQLFTKGLFNIYWHMNDRHLAQKILLTIEELKFPFLINYAFLTRITEVDDDHLFEGEFSWDREFLIKAVKEAVVSRNYTPRQVGELIERYIYEDSHMYLLKNMGEETQDVLSFLIDRYIAIGGCSTPYKEVQTRTATSSGIMSLSVADLFIIPMSTIKYNGINASRFDFDLLLGFFAKLLKNGDKINVNSYTSVLRWSMVEEFQLLVKYGATLPIDGIEVKNFKTIVYNWRTEMITDKKVAQEILTFVKYFDDYLYNNKNKYPEYYEDFEGAFREAINNNRL